MKRLKVGVIGVGSLGQHHARVCQSLPNAELVGVADVIEARARAAADKNGTEWVTDYRKLIDKIDAACIAVPTALHFGIASDLVRAGKSVLVEKPMTATLGEANALCELARKQGVALQVGHIERFNPVMQVVEQHRITPAFIECHRLSPYRFRSTDIGVVLDLMIHDLDILLYLAKSAIESIDAVGVSLIGPREDIANARIRFASGCVANITASRCSLKTMRKIRIFGPEGYIGLDFGNRYAMLVKKSPTFDKTRLEHVGRDWTDLSNLQKQLKFEDMLSVTELALEEYEPLHAEIQSFVNAVLEGRPPVVSGEDGRRAIEAAERVVASIRANGWFCPAPEET
ncbi:MAG: Gfo/Idh/MocA family oxidoreductase [Planctomycetota bacterium]